MLHTSECGTGRMYARKQVAVLRTVAIEKRATTATAIASRPMFRVFADGVCHFLFLMFIYRLIRCLIHSRISFLHRRPRAPCVKMSLAVLMILAAYRVRE